MAIPERAGKDLGLTDRARLEADDVDVRPRVVDEGALARLVFCRSTDFCAATLSRSWADSLARARCRP